ncbi:sensor histidine kinase [Actinocorallia populi]|uniref:sensor histidine kinase n=1 Tax=Actinocorallia populi TaxID=2079200 RepID=UPI001E5ADB49|nr:ATP-binding protein [Actinocorallia populi]
MATIVAAVLLCALGVTAAWLFRKVTYEQAEERAATAAARVADAVRAGDRGPEIRADPEAPIIQVVDADKRVFMYTSSVKGLPPLTTRRPPPDRRMTAFQECFPTGNCYTVQLIRVDGTADSPVVVAASPLPRLVASGMGDLFNVLVVGTAIGLVAVMSWVAIGRALRPVAELRSRYEEITAGDLSRRLPEPQGEDEISGLVRTVNRALDQMEQALERQRQFASDASHELRTPIAGLRANLEDALLHPDDTDFREVAEASLRATDRLELVVNDLLLLARVGSGRESSEDIDLGALLRDEAKPDVKTEIEPGLRVHGARAQLSRLFANLLDNAHRYGGGEIRLMARQDGGRALVVITDEGPGIPDADRERIFGRFTRLDTARSRGAGGTGLGLAIAREVALAHGGSLHAEDSPKGARFVVRLPLQTADQEPTANR